MCKEIFPNLHKHTHHKVPKSLGGKDTRENLVDLCPQCHDLLHNIAYKLVSRKQSTVFLEDTAKMVYKNNQGAVERCMELAKLVRDEIIFSRENEKGQNDFVDLNIKMKYKYKKRLHEWAKSSGISLEDMARMIIFRALSEHYNMTIDCKAEANAVRVNKKKGNQ